MKAINRNLFNAAQQALLPNNSTNGLCFHMRNHTPSTAKLHHTQHPGTKATNPADAAVWVAKGNRRRNSILSKIQEIPSKCFL